MKLLELCEPIFREVCDFNRVASIHPQGYDLRAAVLARFEVAGQIAAADPALASQFEQIRRPLVHFIDDFVVASPLFLAAGGAHPAVASWQGRIIEDELFDTQAGGRLFFEGRHAVDHFDGLDETLKDTRGEAKERLLIFRTCLGLGFGGLYRDNPVKIAEYLTKIRQRMTALGSILSEDPNAEICPDAGNARSGGDPRRDARWFRWVAAAFVILTVGVFVFYFVQFNEGKRELTNLLRQINEEVGR